MNLNEQKKADIEDQLRPLLLALCDVYNKSVIRFEVHVNKNVNNVSLKTLTVIDSTRL